MYPSGVYRIAPSGLSPNGRSVSPSSVAYTSYPTSRQHPASRSRMLDSGTDTPDGCHQIGDTADLAQHRLDERALDLGAVLRASYAIRHNSSTPRLCPTVYPT